MDRGKSKFVKALKIIYAIIYLAVTVYLVWGLLDIVIHPVDNMALSTALYLSIVVIIFGTIGYIISVVVALVGLFVSIGKKEPKGSIIYFIVATLLPVLTEAIIIIICKLLI